MGSEDYSKDRALDTPTLLSSLFSGPYFHDGSLDTLNDVVNWFDEKFKLRLKTKEIEDLTAYLETVGGGIEAYEDTMFTLESEMEEFFFFLSAYEYLKSREKRTEIGITFNTIEMEIKAHKWDVQDQGYLPALNELAGLMGDALKANRAGDRDKVDALVDEYRTKYKENVDYLK